MWNALPPGPNPKKPGGHCTSFWVVGDENCSNLPFALSSVSRHAPDLWTPEIFALCYTPASSQGFSLTTGSEFLYQGLHCASHLGLSLLCR